MSKGYIIVITGGPGLGKSTLVKKLADHYNGAAILEGEEKDFPQRILDDIANNERIFELVLFFRNKAVAEYIEALKIKERGGVVFLDTFWLTNNVYVNEWMSDKFEQEIMNKVSDLDQHFLPYPDTTICLTASSGLIKNFMKKRGRSLEQKTEQIERYVAMTAAHDKFFKQKNIKNTEFVDRTELDFEQKKDFQIVTKIVDKHLKK
jgi:deoxyadenosine/deoxycytidine kinase